MTRVLALLMALLPLCEAPAMAQLEEPDLDPAEPCETSRCLARTDPPSAWWWVPRALVAPPGLVFRTATELLMLAPRLEDEHHLRRLATDIFFDDTRTYGLYPTAFYETGAAPNIGVRFIHRDLLQRRERLLLRVGFGGLYDQVYEASVHSGARFARLRLTASIRYRLADDLSFFGLGNAERGSIASSELPLPASNPPLAVRAHYSSQEARGAFVSALALGGPAHLTFAQVLRQRRLSIGSVEDRARGVTDVYAGDSVLGFGRELVDMYSELGLRWDDTRRTRLDLPRALPSTGWRVATWLGMQRTLYGPESSFGRVGFDVQRFIDLYRGNRVLRLRLRTAWLVGALHKVAFIDLPSLGGAQLLRGYDGARFRDHGTLLASVEYRYPVQENIESYLFVDAGRTYGELEELSLPSLRASRVGFGGGLFVHTAKRALFRVQLATSIDGGAFLALRVDTTDDLVPTY